MLAANAGDYYESATSTEVHGVRYRDYFDAFDLVRGWLELLDDLGDDFTVEEPVEKIKPTFAYKVSSAAINRANLLRLNLSDDSSVEDGGIPADKLLALAQRIAALEHFADYVEATGQMYDAECRDREKN
jgi:hypothetical protein